MRKTSDRPGRVLTTAEAAALLGLRPGTLARLRLLGAGPPFLRHGARIFYDSAQLIAWSKTIQRCTRPRLASRLRLLAGLLALLACLLTLYLWKRPLLIYNLSPSVPIGLYRVIGGPPRPGDLAVVQLPQHAGWWAERRGYLAASAYLLKPVAAVAGDRVCRFGLQIFVRHRSAAQARTKDRHARMMPSWQGCRTLTAGELFLLADHPTSLDSRYFGPIEAAQVSGIAVLIWPARAI